VTVTEIQTRPRADDELAALEALWEAPPAQTDVPRKRNLDRFRRPLGFAWGAVLLSLFLAPAPEQEVATPWYAWVLLGAFTLAVIGMFTVFAAGGIGQSFGASLVAGALGLAIGVGCLTTEHHAGGWAAYEISAFSGLFLASAAGLFASRQR
jgi:small-conductance mechanosensitive channel